MGELSLLGPEEKESAVSHQEKEISNYKASWWDHKIGAVAVLIDSVA